jgi:hypothetical protein
LKKCRGQGDQIWRIIAPWLIAFFGQFFLIPEEAQIVGLLVSKEKSYVLLLPQKWVWQHFGQY